MPWFPKLLSVLILVFGLVGCAQPKDTSALDEEISRVQEQLTVAREQLSSYGDGAIRAIIQLQIKVLETTLAMLDQKRASMLYMISLNYNVDATVNCDLSLESLGELDSDIAITVADLDEAQSKAEQYNGGLIHAIALAEVVTHRVTLASLNQRKLMEKWGIPMFSPSALESERRDSVRVLSPAGPVVSDEEAL